MKRRPPGHTRTCASCGAARGNTRKGWNFVHDDDGAAVGVTCPACPEWHEPIRRLVDKSGAERFRCVVDATPAGAAKRRQATKTVATLDDARAWIAQVRAEVRAAGAYAARDVETVEALCTRWLASRRDVRAITRRGYATWLAPVLRRIGSRDVREVTVTDVEDLTNWLATEGRSDGSPLSPRSVRAALVALSQVFDLAAREGLVSRNVVQLARRPRMRRVVGRDLEHWSWSTLVKFREHADTDPLAGAWRLTLSGMTRADVLGLRWSDVDLDAGVANVSQGRVAVGVAEDVDEPKSAQRVRAVPFEQIHPGTVALLRRLKARQAEDQLRAGAAWHESGYVVVDALGVPLKPARYSARFARLCEAAGVPRIRLHSVRHSLAFRLNALGVPAADSAALLGHTVDVFLSIYSPHAGSAGIAAAAQALGRAAAAE